MNIQDYLMENERPNVQLSAYDNPDAISESEKGTLACTPFRVVFVNKNDITDISMDAVNSIEYQAPALRKKYIWYFIGVLSLAILALVVGSSQAGDLSRGAYLVGVLFGFFSVLVVIQAYLRRRATLAIHTPTKTYTFISNDSALQSVGHAVRGHEAKR